METIPEVLYLKIAGYLDMKTLPSFNIINKSVCKQKIYRFLYSYIIQFQYELSIKDTYEINRNIMRKLYSKDSFSKYLYDIQNIFFNENFVFYKRKTFYFKNIYNDYSIEFKNYLRNRKHNFKISEFSLKKKKNHYLHIQYRLTRFDIQALKKQKNYTILALIY